ncbi:hypothetical protein GGQ85_004225 [Nitrobacter vulgaris]|nr:hypothetical protein [Nitrobacter vulgaris]
MRYPASETLEIWLVEQSRLSAQRTLQKLGIPRSTFNRWYDRFLTGGIDALEDRRPRPNRVWNRIPEETRDQIIELALNEPELSPRELAVTFTDTKGYFVSESIACSRPDLITSPAFIVIKAADEFHDKTTAPNQLWQTDLTYLKVSGWGWFDLSTVLDDFSRYIIVWKLCTTMKAEDATDTLTMALQASGCDSARVVQRPRLLSGAWQLLGLRVSPQGLLRILSERLGVPFVTTVHGRLDLPGLPDVAREFSSASFVAISDTQRQQLPDAKWIATIQHGLPSCLFRPSYEPGSYLAIWRS